MGKKGPNSGRRDNNAPANGHSNGGNADEFAAGTEVTERKGAKEQKKEGKKKGNRGGEDFWGEGAKFQEEQAMEKITGRVWKLLVVGFFVDHKKVFGGKAEEQSKPPSSRKKEDKNAESLQDRVFRYVEFCRNNFTMLMSIGFVVLLFAMKAGEESWRPGVQESEAINPYDALGVSRTAPQGEIRKVYKKLALEWHPDKHDADCQKCKDRFAEISIANDKIGTVDARKAYDSNRNKRKDLNLGSSVQLTEASYEQQVVRGTAVWAVMVLDSHQDSGDSGNALWAELSDSNDSKFTRFAHIDVGTPEGAALVARLGIRSAYLPMLTRLCSGKMGSYCSAETKLLGGRDKDAGTKQIRRFIYDVYPRAQLPFVGDAAAAAAFLTGKPAARSAVLLAAPYASVIPSNPALNPAPENKGFSKSLPSKVKDADTLQLVQQVMWLYKTAYEYADLGIDFRVTDFDTAAEAAALVGDEELKARVEFFASHQDSASGKSLQDLPYFALSAGAVESGEARVAFTAIPKRENASLGARQGKLGLEVYGSFALAEAKNVDEDKALKLDAFSRKLRKAAGVDAKEQFLPQVHASADANNAFHHVEISELAHAVHNAPDSNDLSEAGAAATGGSGPQKSQLLEHLLHKTVQNLLLNDGSLKKLSQSNYDVLCAQKPRTAVVKRQCLLVSEKSGYAANGWELVNKLNESRAHWLKENAEQIVGAGGDGDEKELAVQVLPVRILASDALGLRKQHPVKAAFHKEVLQKHAAPDASFAENLFVAEFGTDRVARVPNVVNAEELVTSLTYDDVHFHDSEVPLSFMMGNDQSSVAGELWALAFGDGFSLFVCYFFLAVWLASLPEAKAVKKVHNVCYVYYPLLLVAFIVCGSYQLRKNVLSIVDFS